ncbi:MAG: amidohydrolase [Bacteroidetes bacterium]|nr:amidohydrolase [Bacteroidota bacterium]
MRGGYILLLLFCFSSFVSGQDKKEQLRQRVFQKVEAVIPRANAWREDIHQNPELGNREFRTSKLIAAHLRSLGMEVHEGIAFTGVVGLLKGAKPGPCIALRADMDALPVTERVNIPFASKARTTYNGQEVGVMHACGHDAHVAMLMATAEVFSSFKAELSGSVKFIFQPAEEGPPEGEEGGASLMVKQGVMENPKVDMTFGFHIESDIEAGEIHYKPGAFMAAADWFSTLVRGKGSHGSQPWKGIDPVQVSAQIIDGLQAIVSRQSELTKAPVVITVGKINGGVRQNIIPETCQMAGTIRTLDADMQKEVHEKIKHTAKYIAEASGATAEVTIETKALVTYNDPDLLKKVLPSLEKAAGADRVKPREWVTGAEDFSYYGTKAPAVFLYLGGMPKGNDPNKAPPHHTADFYIDNSGMPTGIRAFCSLVLDMMQTK